MKKIYFVRHGQAEHNSTKVFSDADSALTKLGQVQALQAVQAIRKLTDNIGAIIASPLVRTRETAHIIAAELGFSPEQIIWDERIRELYHGKFAGAWETPESRKQRDQLMLTRQNSVGVEWIGDLAQRIESFVADVRKRPEEEILIVGHNTSGRMLRRILGDQERTKPMQRLKTAEIIQLYPYVEADANVEKVL